jgi:hypothetical protein
MVFGNGDFAATVAFAGILAGATVIAGLAATLSLAVVLAFATMLGRRRTTTMAFAGILGGTAVVTRFAAPLAFAVVHALAHMLLAAFSRRFLSNHTASLCASNYSCYGTEQQFVEISSFHTHPGIPRKSSQRYVYPARDHGTYPAA